MRTSSARTFRAWRATLLPSVKSCWVEDVSSASAGWFKTQTKLPVCSSSTIAPCALDAELMYILWDAALRLWQRYYSKHRVCERIFLLRGWHTCLPHRQRKLTLKTFKGRSRSAQMISFEELPESVCWGWILIWEEAVFCGHLLQRSLAVTCGPFLSLAVTRVAASDRKWPQVILWIPWWQVSASEPKWPFGFLESGSPL